MLFEARFWPLIAAGEVTLTFRRWKRRQVVAGNRYRTPVGFIEVSSVEVVDPSRITDVDARRSGYESADAVRAALRARRSSRHSASPSSSSVVPTRGPSWPPPRP